jgi:hypothetical protein
LGAEELNVLKSRLRITIETLLANGAIHACAGRLAWFSFRLVRFHFVKPVCPSLHHLPPVGQPFRLVVVSTDSAGLVRKLQLDQIWMHAAFVQLSASHRPETMRRHFVAIEAEPSQCGV